MWGRILSYLIGQLGVVLLQIVKTETDRHALDDALELARVYVRKFAGLPDIDDRRKAAIAAIKADLAAAGKVVEGFILDIAIGAAVGELTNRTVVPVAKA